MPINTYQPERQNFHIPLDQIPSQLIGDHWEYGVEYPLYVVFQRFRSMLRFAIFEDQDNVGFQIKLDSCLAIEIKEENQNNDQIQNQAKNDGLAKEYNDPTRICIIDHINSKNRCNIPKTKSGTWLTELAKSIGRSMKCDYAELVDSSSVPCGTGFHKVDFNFKLLRLFQGKKSFYSSLGFHYLNEDYEEIHREKMNYYSSISARDYFGLGEVIEAVGTVGLGEEIETVEAVEMIDLTYKPKDNETVSEYMVSLFNLKECQIYQNIVEDIIFSDRDLFNLMSSVTMIHRYRY